MKPCEHPAIDDNFGDWRGVGRLCDACLLRLHELAVGPVPHHWITGVPNRFRGACRDLCVAQIVGCLDPSPEDAHLVAVAARVVAECDDGHAPLEDVVARWVWGQPTGLRVVDQLLAPHRDRMDAVLGAVDRVVERVDSE